MINGPKNRLLEFLKARPRPDGAASRSNRRQPSSARVELAWLSSGSWKTSRARLIDISHGGAALNSRESPMVGDLARIRIVEGDGSPWVEAKILGVDLLDSRRNRVRIRFEGNCPGFLLCLAVVTTDQAETVETAPQTRSWSMVKSELME